MTGLDTQAAVPRADGPLAALFAPRGIAVVGASRSPAKLGAVLARSLRAFPGTLAPVNPRDATMLPSVAAADGPVDLAILCVPAAASAAALADAAAGGARAAVVCGGGFAEAGGPGIGYQDALAAVAAETGIRVLGPNTSGFLVPGRRLTASFVPGIADVPAGRVAVVAASGGVNHALAFALAEAGHGISLAVGLGNAVDVDTAAVLDHLATDPGTAAVALHVESVADGPRLLDAVARVAAHRPVVALVVGRHDVAAFARSHTGALATSWRTTRAALRQAGAVLVDSERELVDAVGALSLQRLAPHPDPGVGVLTGQAGPGLLLLDDLRGRRASVPPLTAATRETLAGLLPPLTYQANPVDTGRPDPGFAKVLGAVAADSGVDVVAAYALHEPDALDLVAAVDGAAVGVPLVVGVGGAGAGPAAVRRELIARGVPAVGDPSGVAAAVGALVAEARARAALRSPGSEHGRPAADRTAPPAAHARTHPAAAGPFDEDRAKSLVASLGFPTPRRTVCTGRAAAHAALARLGGPVAVKVLDAAILHKTEVGGVRLGIGTPAQLDAALEAIGADRVLVEEMAPPGVDLIVGARRDPVFGVVVLVGLGGTVAEVLADVAVRVAPLTRAEAAAMVDDLAGAALLDGFRGGPVLDRAELGTLVARLGALLDARPDLTDVEINPLRLTRDGLVALDAVITLTEETPDGRTGL
ncbi:acetate--CoA ligase family protein [Pseudonocardia sp.]|uniref:acetate--CoA ligase family protein n=1 Tax=Pseudonocardia sp. TaxID=60912 RepID=UPI003D108AA0